MSTENPITPAQTPQQIQDDIVRTRAELQQTVDELSERLDPRTQANEAMAEAKVAVADLRRRVTGELRGADEPEPTTKGWVVLGAAAAAAAVVVAGVIRKL
jgi:hypothetical protein